MNSVSTAKALSGVHSLAGRKWSYDYRCLQGFDEANLKNYIARQQPKFAARAKAWSVEQNSEWICRHYLAAKMVMMATLQLNSLQYARERNLRLVSPYLAYYTVFSLLRSVLFNVPEADWNEGRLIQLSHKRVGSFGFDHLRYLDKDWAKQLISKFQRLRHERELISYWHPSSGDSEFQPFDDMIELSTSLAEIAQLNSELLEASLTKYSEEKTWKFLDSYVEQVSQVELVGDVHVDWNDMHRLDYLSRKWPRPTSLQHTITEGHVDDFFGAWCPEGAANAGDFDPDTDIRLIFDFF